MGLLTTSDVPEEQQTRNLVRKAILDSVAIYLDQGFTNSSINVRRLWEEVGNVAIGEMTRYRNSFLLRAKTDPEDPADLTCNMS